MLLISILHNNETELQVRLAHVLPQLTSLNQFLLELRANLRQSSKLQSF